MQTLRERLVRVTLCQSLDACTKCRQPVVLMYVKRSDVHTVGQNIPETEMSPAHVVHTINENLNTRNVYSSTGCSKT